jgi:predicted secreted protein
LAVINKCKSEDELDFLFPEITRIHSHDMAMLQSWKNHAAWIQELSSAEKEFLANANFTHPKSEADLTQSNVTTIEPQEQLFYESLKSKSHFLALRDQLKLIVSPTLRSTYENFVSQQAQKTNYKALAPSTWQGVPDLTVVNLYWYFNDNETQGAV